MLWNLPNTLTWLRIAAIPLIILLFYMPYHWSDPAAGLLFAAAGVTGPGSIGAAESEVIGALQALGYSLSEAREASPIALADATIGGTLEDRVKAALRGLPRE